MSRNVIGGCITELQDIIDENGVVKTDNLKQLLKNYGFSFEKFEQFMEGQTTPLNGFFKDDVGKFLISQLRYK